MQRFPAEAEPLDRARSEVVDEDVGTGEEGDAGVAVLGPREIERDAAFSAVQPHEVGRLALHDGVVPPREIAAAGALDLYDVGTEVGEMPRAERPRDGLLERDHADAVERERHSAPLRPARATRRPISDPRSAPAFWSGFATPSVGLRQT